MRLRKPCEHDRYEEHRVGSWSNVPGLVPNEQTCPGGEFLPEDALVFERVATDADGILRVDRESLAAAVSDFDEWPDPDSSEPWEVIMTAATNYLLILSALAADQVGEPG